MNTAPDLDELLEALAFLICADQEKSKITHDATGHHNLPRRLFDGFELLTSDQADDDDFVCLLMMPATCRSGRLMSAWRIPLGLTWNGHRGLGSSPGSRRCVRPSGVANCRRPRRAWSTK
jgi:hypothetical protein